MEAPATAAPATEGSVIEEAAPAVEADETPAVDPNAFINRNSAIRG